MIEAIDRLLPPRFDTLAYMAASYRRSACDRWIEHAIQAGLDRETVIALFTLAIEAGYQKEAPHGRRS